MILHITPVYFVPHPYPPSIHWCTGGRCSPWRPWVWASSCLSPSCCRIYDVTYITTCLYSPLQVGSMTGRRCRLWRPLIWASCYLPPSCCCIYDVTYIPRVYFPHCRSVRVLLGATDCDDDRSGPRATCCPRAVMLQVRGNTLASVLRHIRMYIAAWR